MIAIYFTSLKMQISEQELENLLLQYTSAAAPVQPTKKKP